MRCAPTALATALLLSSLAVLAPTASASDCVEREYPPNVYGGVVGMTWMLAIDTANQACHGSSDAAAYGDLVCDWLMGVTCEEVPDETLGLVTWFLP